MQRFLCYRGEIERLVSFGPVVQSNVLSSALWYAAVRALSILHQTASDISYARLPRLRCYMEFFRLKVRCIHELQLRFHQMVQFSSDPYCRLWNADVGLV